MALILSGGDGGNTTITGNSGNLSFTTDSNLMLANTVTGGFSLPSGNTAQRPSSPANGAIRYNTDTASVEGYAAGTWGSIGGVSGGVNIMLQQQFGGF